MFDARRRRIAWIFALALLLELALLCCASTHAAAHLACAREDCPICGILRAARHREAASIAALWLPLAALALGLPQAPRRAGSLSSLIELKVRLND